MLLNVINNAKYCHTGIGVGYTFYQQYCYWHRQYLIAKVLLLVLAINYEHHHCQMSITSKMELSSQ